MRRLFRYDSLRLSLSLQVNPTSIFLALYNETCQLAWAEIIQIWLCHAFLEPAGPYFVVLYSRITGASPLPQCDKQRYWVSCWHWDEQFHSCMYASTNGLLCLKWFVVLRFTWTFFFFKVAANFFIDLKQLLSSTNKISAGWSMLIDMLRTQAMYWIDWEPPLCHWTIQLFVCEVFIWIRFPCRCVWILSAKERNNNSQQKQMHQHMSHTGTKTHNNNHVSLNIITKSLTIGFENKTAQNQCTAWGTHCLWPPINVHGCKGACWRWS